MNRWRWCCVASGTSVPLCVSVWIVLSAVIDRNPSQGISSDRALMSRWWYMTRCGRWRWFVGFMHSLSFVYWESWIGIIGWYTCKVVIMCVVLTVASTLAVCMIVCCVRDILTAGWLECRFSVGDDIVVPWYCGEESVPSTGVRLCRD